MNRNILILSAGRRVELLAGFQASAAKLSIDCSVFCADSKPSLSAACQVAEKSFFVPHVSDSGYIERLRQLCDQKSIGLVVPTIDTELMKLASVREAFFETGTSIVVSDLDLVAACRDKRETLRLFSQLDIGTPSLYTLENLRFPCFSKLFDGSSSIGALRLNGPADLTQEIRQQPNRIYQELVPPSYREITVDLYYDRSSSLKALVPRERLEVRGGEVSKGVTRRDWVYSYLENRLKKIEGARGCLTFQLFAGEPKDEPLAIEINPRFGGGFPLTLAAGANFPEWLIREHILGEPLPFFDDWEANLLMLRYDAKVLVNNHE